MKDKLQRQQLNEARSVIEAELSHSDIHDALRDAIRVQFPDSYVWLQDVFDAWVVAHIEGKETEAEATIPAALYRFGYVIDAQGAVALGVGEEVRRVTTYEPVSAPAAEATRAPGVVEIGGELDYVPLVERAVRTDGTIAVKIIQPGVGSSGYYPAPVLERDGPKVFTRGTKMYADHATPTEEAERPEGSIKNLVAELINDARWEPTGSAGAGLYADAKVFEHWQPFIEELAPHIGVSIRASGRAKPGEVNGKRVPVIEELLSARSIDFVTMPGAGGQIQTLFESARARASETITNGGDSEVDETKLQEAEAARVAAETKLEEEKAKSTELATENARLKEAEILRETESYLEANLPQAIEGLAPAVWALTRARLAESLKGKAVLRDGALDTDAFKEAIEAAVKAEVEYLAKVTESGKVRGMGPGSAEPGNRAKLVEQWKAKYISEGRGEETATKLAEIAAGR